MRCWMSAGAKAATPERVGLPVLDAQAAELKAERLWGMADAHKPRPSQTVTAEVSEVGTVFFSTRVLLCAVFLFPVFGACSRWQIPS